MKLTTAEIYSKIQELNRDFKEELKRQGVVIPLRKKNGSIQIGSYFIKKGNDGFYSVLDFRNEAIIGRINLPQTAAVLANKLALGRLIDDDILQADIRYGHALFEELLHRRLAENSLKSSNYDKAEVMYTKLAISKHRKEQFKREIDKGFEKLVRFR
jgi:hypothetical protein